MEIYLEDYVHCEFMKDHDIPFHARFHESQISGPVEEVVGWSGRHSGTVAARKCIPMTSVDKDIKNFQTTRSAEARLLHKARHSHVVQLIMTYFYNNPLSSPSFSIIMDCAREHFTKGNR